MDFGFNPFGASADLLSEKVIQVKTLKKLRKFRAGFENSALFSGLKTDEQEEEFLENYLNS